MMKLNHRFLYIVDSYRYIRDSLQKYHRKIDLHYLFKIYMISVTTTGLAYNLNIFRRIRAKMMMIEKAGEILKIYIFTIFLSSVKYVILIKDYEQLRL